MSFIKLRIYQSVLGDVEILVYDSLGTIGRSCTGNGKLYNIFKGHQGYDGTMWIWRHTTTNSRYWRLETLSQGS